MAYKPYTFVVLLALLLDGCGLQISPGETAIPTLLVITSTLPTTLTPRPIETPFPPPSSPTVVSVEGITSTQLNVRAQPSTASEVLGVLPVNATVQIVGRDPGENWWQILYPQAGQVNEGKGWVTSQYLRIAGRPEVPVIEGGGSNPSNANVAVIQQRLNVRSGPGTSFNSLGMLSPQDVVALTGKDSNGAWLQIEFAAGPEGRGWINAAFTRAKGVENLPIVSDSGQVIGTGTPANTPPPPSPTVDPAPNDNDSAQAPAISVVFTATGTRSLHFSSDVSFPTGDSEDWVQFTPYTVTVLLELTCRGNGQLTLSLFENNQPVPDWGSMSCGGTKVVAVRPGRAHLLEIQAAAAAKGFNYILFTVKVRSLP